MPGNINLVINPASMRQVILRLQPGRREKLTDGFKDPRDEPPLPLNIAEWISFVNLILKNFTFPLARKMLSQIEFGNRSLPCKLLIKQNTKQQ